VLFSDDRSDSLAREAVADKDHTAAVVTGDKATSGGGMSQDEFDRFHEHQGSHRPPRAPDVVFDRTVSQVIPAAACGNSPGMGD
jgi:hypothetical protein